MLNKLLPASGGHVYHMPLFPLPLRFHQLWQVPVPQLHSLRWHLSHTLTKMLLQQTAIPISPRSETRAWYSPTICVVSCLPTSAATWHLSPSSAGSQLFPERHGQQSLQHLTAGLDEGVIIDYFYLTEKTSAQAGEKTFYTVNTLALYIQSLQVNEKK